YCTGTVYCDKFLHGHGFLGECVFPNHRTKGCIVYKSHENKPKDLKQFDRAVILIRNPYDALKAYFNWTFGKPVNTSSGNIKTSKKSPKSPRDRFHALVDLSRFNSTEWKSYVKGECFHWQSVYKVWLKTFVNRSLLVRYVDLKESLVPTLRQISKFLNVTTSEMEYTCTYMNREGQHHRNQKYDLRITDLFTEEQIDMVNGAILNVMATMKNGYRLKDFIFKPF
ncbi:WSC domain-containing protein 1-like, partial [Mizuhopecten yessoensis]|uniref:WSC domain-containing protein 1-like n=1 Tax=Mizuhopecten yessoensis TaxID=6573 RepID=UPI000B45D043